MKISVCSASMADCTIDKTLQLVKQCGYDGVEWRFARIDPELTGKPPSFWGNNLSNIDADSDEASLIELKETMQAMGLQTPILGARIACGDIEETRIAMQAARILGCHGVRIGVPGYDRRTSYQELLAAGRAYLQEVEALSREYGVRGLLEIHHGNIICSASLARRLVEGFDPARIGIIYDPGNFVFEGFEPYRLGLEVLGDYLAHVHVKNCWWFPREASLSVHKLDREISGVHDPLWQANWCCIPQGIVHWPQIIDDLKAVGYDGWLSMEDFSSHASTEIMLRDNLAYIKSLL